jgi:hypothetical protein
MAANLRGELVGVPTQASAGTDVDPVDCRPVRDTNRDGEINGLDDCVPLGGFLNGVRPVNLAVEMMDAVESGTEYEPIAEPAPPDFDVSGVEFGQPLFSDVEPETRPTEDVRWIPSGATRLCGWWEYSGMADGVHWDAVWALEGEVQQEVSFIDEVWSGGESGDWWVCVVGEDPIDEGLWDLTLNVEKEWVAGSFVAVGEALQPVEFTVANQSSVEICYLYISPAVMQSWGTDWLGPDVALDPGESGTFELPPTRYDLLGTDCDGGEIFQDTVDVSGPQTYTFE